MRKILSIVLALILLGWGCTFASAAVPADFSFIYNYDEGSLPPPYHYEYKIKVKVDGAVELNFFPDYIVEAGIEDATPMWVEKTSISKEKLADLYQQMEKIGVFAGIWQEPEKKIVGGSYSWLKVTANGKQFETPSYLIEKDEQKLAPLYKAIDSLISKEVWAKIWEQRQEYEKAHKTN